MVSKAAKALAKTARATERKRTSRAATKAVTEAAKASKAGTATKAPVEAVEAEPVEPVTSLVRDATALRVLDLTLAAMERRLVEEPDALTSASIGAVSRLLALYFKERKGLDDGSAQRAEHERMLGELGGLPAYSDEGDKDDPMLQGPGRGHQESTVSPADIAAVSKFED